MRVLRLREISKDLSVLLAVIKVLDSQDRLTQTYLKQVTALLKEFMQLSKSGNRLSEK